MTSRPCARKRCAVPSLQRSAYPVIDISHSSSALDPIWERFNLLFVYSQVILNRSTIISSKYCTGADPVCAHHVQCNTVTALSPNRKSFHRPIDSLSSTSCFPSSPLDFRCCLSILVFVPLASLVLAHQNIENPQKGRVALRHQKVRRAPARAGHHPKVDSYETCAKPPSTQKSTPIEGHYLVFPVGFLSSSTLPDYQVFALTTRDWPGYLPRVSSSPSRVWRAPSAQIGDQDFQDPR